MEARQLLEALHVAERLKDETRHCTTTKGAPENVASHSWRMALMAYFMTDEFPELDMNKVIKMCLIHDLGECFTGDIPVFRKTPADEDREEALLFAWVDALPGPLGAEMRALYAEMAARETLEARKRRRHRGNAGPPHPFCSADPSDLPPEGIDGSPSAGPAGRAGGHRRRGPV